MEIGNVFSSSSCAIVHKCIQMHSNALPGSPNLEILRERESTSLPPCLLSIHSWDPCAFLVFGGLALDECCFQYAESRVQCCWICMLSHPHCQRTGCVLLLLSMASLAPTGARTSDTSAKLEQFPRSRAIPVHLEELFRSRALTLYAE